MKRIALDKRGISVDGQYRTLLCASLFYFRIPKEHWEERVDSLLATGYNCVDVYFPWNYHELAPGKWDFSGSRDVDAFLRLCTEKGLFIVARPGPYICSEWDGGALPPWVCAAGRIREADESFLAAVGEWYDRVLPVLKRYEYNGRGGIILMQLDNELDFFDCPSPEGYIAALRDMALSHGIGVPLFCCAGQLNAARAGGLTEGVYPTYNFYPDSTDATYDAVMAGYTRNLGKRDLPLLVTETNRDHFLLRRELAAGAKLLGAYNQVGGSNFGFTASVNNWGEPLAFLSTLYDFGSMITPLGDCGEEAEAARVFSSMLAAFGPELAAALPYEGEIVFSADFSTLPRLHALKLAGGGVLVNVPNFSDRPGAVSLTVEGATVRAEVAPRQAPFLPFGVKAGGCVVAAASGEIVRNTEKELVFCCDGAPYALLECGGKCLEVAKDTEIAGLSVRFLSRKAAADLGRAPIARGRRSRRVTEVKLREGAPAFREVSAERGLDMPSLGVWRGYARYTAEVEKGCEVFVEGAADLITAHLDGAYADTRTATGIPELYSATKTGRAVFTVERWGNSNFDDSRLPSIRIACRKGLSGVYSVREKRDVRYFDFFEPTEFGAGRITVPWEPLGTVLNVSKWNTTRIPAICAYTFRAARASDKLYLKVTDRVECAAYVDGALAGRGDYGYIDLTPYAPLGKEVAVTVTYRKPNWAVDCGAVTLYQLARANVACEALTDDMLNGLTAGEGLTCRKLPVTLARGKTYLAEIELPVAGCCYVRLAMKDVKATCAIAGHVVSRMIGEWSGAPCITGGSRDTFYVPAAWSKEDNTLKVYFECIGESPALEEIEITERIK